MKTLRFFIGTHASAGQDSLCLCEADFEAGSFSTLHSMREISDPTYLALSADRILYTFGKTAAGVSVYAIRDQVVLNSLPCASGGPFRQYSGVGYDSSDRQKGPHAHYAVFHKDRDEVLICDLGLDMVYVYELDRKAHKLQETNRSIRLPDGSGPRHLAFSDKHPGMLFVLTEMANTIFTYRFDPESDKYILEQQISAVCDGASGASPSDPALMQPPTADNGSIGCAIRFTKDGKYLFVSSRLGYQSISAFRCDPDGKLCSVSRCLCGGITPRDFNVFESDDPEDPDIHLLVASLLDMKMQAVKPTCILPI